MNTINIIITFSFVLYTNLAIATPHLIDKVVALVNNNIILESEVNSMLDTISRDTQKTYQQLPDNKILYRQILNQLIIDNIILQLAQHSNIIISDEYLTQVIVNIASHNHITLNQLRNSLINNGIDYNTYRAQIRKEILIAEISNNAASQRVTIFPQEIESLKQQIAIQTNKNIEYNLSHFLIPFSKNQKQKQLNKAKIIMLLLTKKSKNGTTSNKVINNYLINTQIKSYQLGWRKLEELPSLFTMYLKDTQKGNVIGPIRSGIGFHVLKVNDIRNNYQQVITKKFHVRHILLRTSDKITDQQAFNKLKVVALQIHNKCISFAEAAKQLSQDVDSAKQGGDLGWLSVNEFNFDLITTILHLKKGEISKPVHSSIGWHLLQLLDISKLKNINDAYKNQAYKLLFNRKFNEEMQIWTEEQRAAAYVKILSSK